MSTAAVAASRGIPARRTSLERQRRWFLVWCLAPSLAVLMLVTLAPMVYLVAPASRRLI